MTGLLIISINWFNHLIINFQTFESFKFDYIVNYNTIQFGDNVKMIFFTIDQRLTGIKMKKAIQKKCLIRF